MTWGLGCPAGHDGVRPRARAHARRAAGGGGGCRHVQRGQARGRAAGGADRRPRVTWSPGCDGIPWPARCAPTRRSWPAWPQPWRSTAPGGRHWTSPCGGRSPWIRPTSGRAPNGSWGSSVRRRPSRRPRGGAPLPGGRGVAAGADAAVVRGRGACPLRLRAPRRRCARASHGSSARVEGGGAHSSTSGRSPHHDGDPSPGSSAGLIAADR